MTSPYLADRLPDILPGDPFAWLEAWLTEATEKKVQRNPNAMTLSTVSADGQPSARIVLAKSLDTLQGYVVFYTNYRSQKTREIDDSDRVSVVFHWDSMGRQVRVEGAAVRSPAAESDAYFASRDRGSQIGAWGSDQSQPLESRDTLLKQLHARAVELGVADNDRIPVPRPAHWGGIRVWASAIELWIEGADRVHDRARWERELTANGEHAFTATPWSGTRLQP